MSPSNPVQDAFELWKTSLEEGTQAWLRALGQPSAPQATAPPAVDFSQFWRPILAQGMDLWQKAAQAGGTVSPEFAQQWKGFLDRWIDAWSKALAQAMGTEAFAQALGRYLDQTLTVQAPVRKAVEQQTDAAVRALGLPSRSQVVGLASQLVGLEERVEGLEDRLDEIRSLLTGMRRDLGDEGERAKTPRESRRAEEKG
jgi:Poly(R)-hydroxyalkanoic acid synthase subunit (PHA_synth_III_E)